MFTLPDLSYNFNSLEPHIDARTMEIHYSKHHQAYVDKLNAALADHADLQTTSVEELLRTITELPESVQVAVQNHGGGHVNHTLFWETLTPRESAISESESLSAEIDATFGSFGEFKEQFTTAAVGQFGSGWSWLVVTEAGDLEITATSNQDSPLMHGKTPILGLDVWEHAYYLQYQNRRPEYVAAFWNVVDWQVVEQKLLAARAV